MSQDKSLTYTSYLALGEILGVEKLPAPGEQAESADWIAYCSRDVEILRRTVLSPRGSVSVDAAGNRLIVTDETPAVERAGSVLATLDRR